MVGKKCVSKATLWKCSNAGDQGSILGEEDPLEKGMVIHSSLLARRIPWTEKPSSLQFVGSQRVRHN